MAEWMPVTTATARFTGSTHERDDMPRDCESHGSVLELAFETDAVWLAVEVVDEYWGHELVQLAGPEGITIDTCRLRRSGFEAGGPWVRVQPFGPDGAGGGWTLPEAIQRAGPP